MIRVSSPMLEGNEKKYVLDCLDRGELSSVGPYVERFETAFAKLTASTYCVACCNGTAALHLALIAAGVKAGDKVIVPALTYVATANAVAYCGAIPIFSEIDEKTWCMDAQSVAKLIKSTKGVKAIVPVHLYGVPCDMTLIGSLAHQNNCLLIEDAAEAHGAKWTGHVVGGVSDLGIFSFYGNKLLSAGEGGCVVTDNTGFVEALRLYRGQGVSTGSRFYHSVIGYNYRLTNIQAAIALAQLETLAFKQLAHKRVFEFYNLELADFVRQEVTARCESANWLFTLLVPEGTNRDLVVKQMLREGVETRPTFVPLTQLPMYTQPTPPIAQMVGERGISLPTHGSLDESQLQTIVSVFRKAVKEC